MTSWNFGLPVVGAVPIWFTPVQMFHGVFLNEVLMLGYIGFALFSGLVYASLRRNRALTIALVIAALGLLGTVSVIINLRPMHEIAAVARYFVLAPYFVFAATWARRYSPTFVLRTFLLGVLAGGAVNIYYTFKESSVYLGGLPMLLGQNGPGGYLGISVVLSAWLMLIRRRRADIFVAVATAAIGFLAASISYSKLAMLMAGCGAIAWPVVLWQDFNTRRARKWYALIAVAFIAFLVAHRDAAIHYVKGVNTFIDYKFRYMDAASISTRSQLFLISGEIMLHHPLFGVGHGGFYDAAELTDAYKNGGTQRLDLGVRGVSHPESSFLYYVVANGFTGLMLTLILFMLAMIAFARTLFPRRRAGKAVWGCLAAAYMIFGLTLPTLFNSAILYVPGAVALAFQNRHARPVQVGAR